jgi:hypothetical protein
MVAIGSKKSPARITAPGFDKVILRPASCPGPAASGSSRAFEAFHRATGAMDLLRKPASQSLAFKSVPSVSFTNNVPMTSDIAAIAIGYQRP